jgi:hypothetical protein
MKNLSTANILQKKPGKIVQLSCPHWQHLIGQAELKGGWVIYGAEKNGKTWLTLQLIKALCTHQKVAYISAEEGMELSFIAAMKRAGIHQGHKIQWNEYMPMQDIVANFSKPKTAQVIVVDNLTMYTDELKRVGTRDIEKKLPNKLFIWLAHEDRKEPSPAPAKMAKKMAKVVINVRGLLGTVVSRYSQGGQIVVDAAKAEIYWGSEILNS